MLRVNPVLFKVRSHGTNLQCDCVWSCVSKEEIWIVKLVRVETSPNCKCDYESGDCTHLEVVYMWI